MSARGHFRDLESQQLSRHQCNSSRFTTEPDPRRRFQTADRLLSAPSEPAASERALCALDTYVPSLSSSTAVSLLSLCTELTTRLILFFFLKKITTWVFSLSTLRMNITFTYSKRGFALFAFSFSPLMLWESTTTALKNKDKRGSKRAAPGESCLTSCLAFSQKVDVIRKTV